MAKTRQGQNSGTATQRQKNAGNANGTTTAGRPGSRTTRRARAPVRLDDNTKAVSPAAAAASSVVTPSQNPARLANGNSTRTAVGKIDPKAVTSAQEEGARAALMDEKTKRHQQARDEITRQVTRRVQPGAQRRDLNDEKLVRRLFEDITQPITNSVNTLLQKMIDLEVKKSPLHTATFALLCDQLITLRQRELDNVPPPVQEKDYKDAVQTTLVLAPKLLAVQQVLASCAPVELLPNIHSGLVGLLREDRFTEEYIVKRYQFPKLDREKLKNALKTEKKAVHSKGWGASTDSYSAKSEAFYTTFSTAWCEATKVQVELKKQNKILTARINGYIKSLGGLTQQLNMSAPLENPVISVQKKYEAYTSKLESLISKHAKDLSDQFVREVFPGINNEKDTVITSYTQRVAGLNRKITSHPSQKFKEEFKHALFAAKDEAGREQVRDVYNKNAKQQRADLQKAYDDLNTDIKQELNNDTASHRYKIHKKYIADVEITLPTAFKENADHVRAEIKKLQEFASHITSLAQDTTVQVEDDLLGYQGDYVADIVTYGNTLSQLVNRLKRIFPAMEKASNDIVDASFIEQFNNHLHTIDESRLRKNVDRNAAEFDEYIEHAFATIRDLRRGINANIASLLATLQEEQLTLLQEEQSRKVEQKQSEAALGQDLSKEAFGRTLSIIQESCEKVAAKYESNTVKQEESAKQEFKKRGKELFTKHWDAVATGYSAQIQEQQNKLHRDDLSGSLATSDNKWMTGIYTQVNDQLAAEEVLQEKIETAKAEMAHLLAKVDEDQARNTPLALRTRAAAQIAKLESPEQKSEANAIELETEAAAQKEEAAIAEKKAIAEAKQFELDALAYELAARKIRRQELDETLEANVKAHEDLAKQHSAEYQRRLQQASADRQEAEVKADRLIADAKAIREAAAKRQAPGSKSVSPIASPIIVSSPASMAGSVVGSPPSLDLNSDLTAHTRQPLVVDRRGLLHPALLHMKKHKTGAAVVEAKKKLVHATEHQTQVYRRGLEEKAKAASVSRVSKWRYALSLLSVVVPVFSLVVGIFSYFRYGFGWGLLNVCTGGFLGAHDNLKRLSTVTVSEEQQGLIARASSSDSNAPIPPAQFARIDNKQDVDVSATATTQTSHAVGSYGSSNTSRAPTPPDSPKNSTHLRTLVDRKTVGEGEEQKTYVYTEPCRLYFDKKEEMFCEVEDESKTPMPLSHAARNFLVKVLNTLKDAKHIKLEKGDEEHQLIIEIGVPPCRYYLNTEAKSPGTLLKVREHEHSPCIQSLPNPYVLLEVYQANTAHMAPGNPVDIPHPSVTNRVSTQVTTHAAGVATVQVIAQTQLQFSQYPGRNTPADQTLNKIRRLYSESPAVHNAIDALQVLNETGDRYLNIVSSRIDVTVDSKADSKTNSRDVLLIAGSGVCIDRVTGNIYDRSASPLISIDLAHLNATTLCELISKNLKVNVKAGAHPPSLVNGRSDDR